MTSSVTMKKGQGYVLGTGAAAVSSSSAAGSSNNVMGNSSTSGNGTSAASSGSSSSSSALSYQEFSVRVPKSDKPMSVMRFNGALNVDMSKWSNLKMVRDDHSSRAKTHDLKFDEPEMPKFGAGSEYGREAREEARRRKYGGNRKKVAAEDQPWVLKATGADKQARRFKGLREGTISSNASYFVFTQATDGQFEVFPVSQWYNFTPIQTYKALSAEEAEEEFGRRDKIMNYFNVMFRKRMRGDEAEGGDKEEEQTSKKKGGGGGGLKVSEMEDWDDVNEMESDEDDEDDTAGKDDKKKKKKNLSKKKKKKGSDSEANEDSDDGDGEGRELDYISDTSGSSEDEEAKEGSKLELPGVEQEPGLSNLLESDSSEDESQEKNKDKDKDDDEKGDDEKDKTKSTKSGNGNKKGGNSNKKSNKKKPGEPQTAAVTENLSDGDSDDDGSDDMNESDEEKPAKPGISSAAGGRDSSSLKTVASSSGATADKDRESTPETEDGGDGRKRKAIAAANSSPAAKKAKMEVSPILLQTAASEGITEEAVRRYLHRKPMTVTELLQKFKSKKTKVSSEDMVTIIASILKKINPTKRNQNGKMYLSLKA